MRDRGAGGGRRGDLPLFARTRAGALPFLIFAACPLSMLVMMKMMMGMGTGGGMGNGAGCHDDEENSSKPDATPEASRARPLTDEQPESGATHREPEWRAL